MTERGIRNSSIRVAVADDVERIESIEAEPDRVPFKEAKILECGHIRIEEARAAHRAISASAKVIH